MDFLIKTIVSALVAIIVPLILDKIRNKSKVKSSQVPWFSWVIACMAGGGIGGFLSALFTLAGGGELIASGFGNWALFGVSVGVLQWVILRNYLTISNYWAVLTMLAWMPFALFQAMHVPDALSWFVIGLIAGVLQWFGLRNAVKKPLLWIIANGIAWFFAGTISFQLGLMMVDAGINLGIAWVIGWSFVGLIGGIILRLFLIVMPAGKKDDQV